MQMKPQSSIHPMPIPLSPLSEQYTEPILGFDPGDQVDGEPVAAENLRQSLLATAVIGHSRRPDESSSAIQSAGGISDRNSSFESGDIFRRAATLQKQREEGAPLHKANLKVCPPGARGDDSVPAPGVEEDLSFGSKWFNFPMLGRCGMDVPPCHRELSGGGLAGDDNPIVLRRVTELQRRQSEMESRMWDSEARLDKCEARLQEVIGPREAYFGTVTRATGTRQPSSPEVESLRDEVERWMTQSSTMSRSSALAIESRLSMAEARATEALLKLSEQKEEAPHVPMSTLGGAGSPTGSILKKGQSRLLSSASAEDRRTLLHASLQLEETKRQLEEKYEMGRMEALDQRLQETNFKMEEVRQLQVGDEALLQELQEDCKWLKEMVALHSQRIGSTHTQASSPLDSLELHAGYQKAGGGAAQQGEQARRGGPMSWFAGRRGRAGG